MTSQIVEQYVPFEPLGLVSFEEQVVAQFGDDLSGIRNSDQLELVKSARASAKQQDALRKGMRKSVSQQPGGNIQAAMPENLSPVIVNALRQQQEYKLNRFISSFITLNYAYQFNLLNMTGMQDVSPFFPAGDIANETDPDVERQEIAYLRYTGQLATWKRQDQLNFNNGGSQISPELKSQEWAAATHLKKKERLLLYANSGRTWENGVSEYKGIVQQVVENAPGNVKNLKGARMTIANIEDAVGDIMELGNDSRIEDYRMFGHHRVMRDLNKRYLDKETIRVSPSDSTQNIIGGRNLAGVTGLGGNTLFLEPYGFIAPIGNDEAGSDYRSTNFAIRKLTTARKLAVMVGRPAAPATLTAAASTGGSGDLAAGNYWYAVAAVNSRGASLVTAATAIVAVTAGQKVTLTITLTTGNPAAVRYNVYRYATTAGSTFDAEKCWYIGEVVDPATGTTTTFVDNGEKNENAYDAIVISQNPMNIQIAKMLDVNWLTLGSTTTTERRMLEDYYAPVVYVPQRIIYFTNVGVE